MLKIYRKRCYVSIDNSPWERLDADGIVMIDERDAVTEHLLLDSLSFSECFDYLENNLVPAMSCDLALFTHTPRIYVNYMRDWESTLYKRFSTISYKITYTEDPNYPLLDIMQNFPAEKTIQYLKERGVCACAPATLKS